MIRFCSDNKQALSPNFVSLALHGLTHRFVLILECETRMYNDNRRGPVVAPPRFAIGGARATLDPRNARVAELLPLAKHKLELPSGWERIHQYVYVLQPATDEHGWQYRSEWSDGPITEADEQWVKANSPGLDVRRRLWMITVVKRDDVVTAKRKLSEALTNRPRHAIIEGELYRQEQGALMKSWPKRYVILYDDCIEVFSGGAPDAGGKKISEIAIVDCDAKMLFGVQCPGREFAFSVRQLNGPVVALFDAENREVRRRWVVAIRYQLAILCPEVNFAPFDYGPPVADDSATRILMCGELAKQGQMVGGWKNRFFQLTPNELQYYEKENPKGFFILKGASVSGEEKSLDFSLKTAGGKVVTMRADNAVNKATWVRAISRQIIVQNSVDEEAEDAVKSPKVVTAVTEVPGEATANEAELADDEEEEEEYEEEDEEGEEEGEDEEEEEDDERGNEQEKGNENEAIDGEKQPVLDEDDDKSENDSDLGELQESDSDNDVAYNGADNAEAVDSLLAEDTQNVVTTIIDTSSELRIVSDDVVQDAPQQVLEPTGADFIENSAIDDELVESVPNAVYMQPETTSVTDLVIEELMATDPIAPTIQTADSVQILHEDYLPEQFGALNLEAHLELESEILDVPSISSDQQQPAIESTLVEVVKMENKKVEPKAKIVISTEEQSDRMSDTKTVAAWTLKGKKSTNAEVASPESMISPTSRARPAFIDPTASKASRYAAMMAERAAAETEEGWGSASVVSPQPTEEAAFGANVDVLSATRLSPRRHNYVPTQQGPMIPKAADPPKSVALRPASQRKPDVKDDEFGQDPESAKIELTPHVAKIKQKIARKPSMVMSRILNLETKIAETATDSPGVSRK